MVACLCRANLYNPIVALSCAADRYSFWFFGIEIQTIWHREKKYSIQDHRTDTVSGNSVTVPNEGVVIVLNSAPVFAALFAKRSQLQPGQQTPMCEHEERCIHPQRNQKHTHSTFPCPLLYNFFSSFLLSYPFDE